MRAARSRRLVGGLTLLALVVIVLGVTGADLPLPNTNGRPSERLLPGLRVAATSMLVRVGSGAPAGSALAFMAVEPSGNLVVSDAGRHAVLRYDPTGHLLSEWGPRLGLLTLDEPAGAAVQGGRYYVLDRGTPRLYRFDTSGRVQAALDLESLGPYGLNGLAVDSSGNVYAADTGRNRILVFTPEGGFVRVLGRGGSNLGAFTQPMALAFGSNGVFYVADWENSRIEQFSATFEATDAWPTGFRPFGVAVDQIGRVFVPDTDRRRVVAYTDRGALLGELGTGSAALEVVPRQVAVGQGSAPPLYVLGSNGIQRLDLENTPPPPQATDAEGDVASLALIALLGAGLVLAFASRRARRTGLLGAAPDRPVRIDAQDRAEAQHHQARTDQHLLVANQPKREQ